MLQEEGLGPQRRAAATPAGSGIRPTRLFTPAATARRVYRPFAERLDAPRAWTALAFRAPRFPLALGLCLLPALVVLAITLTHEPATEAERVRDTFARYISGLITAATIAVGFATLSLRRGIKGLGELKEHVEADRDYAERVKVLTGRSAPSGVGATLAQVLEAAAARARELRDDALAAHAERAARGVRDAGGQPDTLLFAALDFDSESVLQEATTRHRDEPLIELVQTADIGRSYVKTLATQWGISRMSQGIALSAILAVAAATVLLLSYGPSPWAPLILALATLLVLSPLAIFVSFAMRFTFLNQHTLPIGHFVLGPENPRAVETPRRRGWRRGAS